MMSQELVAAIQMERERELRNAGHWAKSRSTTRMSFIERVRTELRRQRQEADRLELELSLVQEAER
jgi:hypothetical protein